ncbi:MAG: hypothetical protein WCK67_11350 [bacterium]
MPKFTVKGTDILHNKTLFKEGDIIELTENEAAKLADYLVPIIEQKQEAKKAVKTAKETSANTENIVQNTETPAEGGNDGKTV